MRAFFAFVLGLSLTGCSQNPVAPLSDDGGVTDSGHVAEAGNLDAPVDRAPIPDGDVLYDATMDTTESQLAAPTFAPAAGNLYPGSAVVIEAPPGFPSKGILYYSVNGQPPNATTGLVYVGPIQVTFAGPTETLMAIATAPGYLDSSVATAVYTDDFPDGCCDNYFPPVTFSAGSESTEVPFLLRLTDQAGANICYTTGGVTVPPCTGGQCVAPSLTYNAAAMIPIAPAVTGPGGVVTVTAIACEVGQASSAPVSATYTLVLAPPYVASQNTVGAGLPGWDWSGTGKPLTAMSVPGDAGSPYGPFVAQQVGLLPCTSASSCTAPGYPLADFICWSTTGPATCGCATPLPLTAATPYATLPASADVSPGGTLSVIACQASTPVNTTGHYAPSSVTTVQF